MFLFQSTADKCWICGSATNPTREHKIKASLLKGAGGAGPFFVVRDNYSQPILAQGINLKKLKFSSTICNDCNSAKTQPYDLEFDKLAHDIVNNAHYIREWNKTLSDEDSYFELSASRNLNRYFAKLLGCHLSDSLAPIPKHLARFVNGKTERNCIFLLYDRPSNALFVDNGVIHFPLAHGGLIFAMDKLSKTPNGFLSSITVGGTRITFRYNYTIQEKLEIRLFNSHFLDTCRQALLT